MVEEHSKKTYNIFEPVQYQFKDDQGGTFYNIKYNIGQNKVIDVLVFERHQDGKDPEFVVNGLREETGKSGGDSGGNTKPGGGSEQGKAGFGDHCDPNKPNSGCQDPFRCAINPVPNICVTVESCNLTIADEKHECGASTLAASIIAALAIASSM